MKLPREFLFGFSEAGFQFEMGFPGQEDPYTDWWLWVHDPDNIASGIVSGHLPENGPGYLALYKQDHDLAEKLGADALRLGLEWSRLFPQSTRHIPASVERDEHGVVVHVEVSGSSLRQLLEAVNKKAVDDYKKVFSDWKSRGKKLIVNLNHFTLPAWIHNPIEVRKRGADRAPAGWLEDDIVVEFAKYAYVAAYIFNEYADMWSTMNEPSVVPVSGYLFTKSGFPPGIPSTEYMVKALRNEIVAHAVVYDILKETTGKPVGVIYNFMWVEPLNEENEEDRKAASNAAYFYNYMFLDSVLTGTSLIFPFSGFKNKADWIGVNYYTRMVVTADRSSPTGWKPVTGYGPLCAPGGVSRAGRPCSDFGWEVYQEGLEKVLVDVYKRYRLPLVVTENGIADAADRYRPMYLLTHLLSLVKAVQQGVDVEGYLHWALIDNYEWAMGYDMKFGLVKVDFETKKRYLRPSALLYREVAKTKEIPEELLYAQ
ncbi:MAG: beta-galactosidase BgaS [Desulfurococcaceae archaeon]